MFPSNFPDIRKKTWPVTKKKSFVAQKKTCILLNVTALSKFETITNLAFIL